MVRAIIPETEWHPPQPVLRLFPDFYQLQRYNSDEYKPADHK